MTILKKKLLTVVNKDKTKRQLQKLLQELDNWEMQVDLGRMAHTTFPEKGANGETACTLGREKGGESRGQVWIHRVKRKKIGCREYPSQSVWKATGF